MAWTVAVKESVSDDLRDFGRREGRKILREAMERLAENPKEESRNMKTLRPNPIAQRELRLFGKYRLLFNVDEESHTATIVLVGEKRGNLLLVQGKEYDKHHESDPAE
jgi:mRNA-degrading endonuclease RelE of RelBE toxin-antitoxin system